MKISREKKTQQQTILAFFVLKFHTDFLLCAHKQPPPSSLKVPGIIL